jgi:hypothetical protein
MTTTNASSANGVVRFGAVPEPGQLVEVRRRQWVVTDVSSGALAPASNGDQHLVGLSSLDEDSMGEEIQVVWQMEAGAQVLEKAGLPSITGWDSNDRLEAFLDAVRWGAVTNADRSFLQSPFRSGITIEDYQLDPLVRAVEMARVNLLIADDVGLGKTIEAGLVIQELLVSRDEFNRLMRVDPDTLTDIQRAARYLYLQRMCYGGRSQGRTFGTSTTSLPGLNLFTLQQLLEDAWLRLAQVTIECLDFRNLIPRYDREHTFFYLDPPYWQIKGYAHNFVERDFHDLAEVLSGMKGRFLMSINDTPEVREIFGRFSIETVELKYSMHQAEGSRSRIRTELLISN